MQESTVDLPSPLSVSSGSTLQNRGKYPGCPEPYFSGYDCDKENVNAKKSINSSYAENTSSAKQACNDYQASRNRDHFKLKSRNFIGLQDRKIGQSHYANAQLPQISLQTDLELKMRWTTKKSNSLTNALSPIRINRQKYWYVPAPKSNRPNLFKWTPEKFKRLQERICAREKLKGLLGIPTEEEPNGRKADQFPEGSEKQLLSFLSEERCAETARFNEDQSLARGLISKNDCKRGKKGEKRTRDIGINKIKIRVEE